MVIRAGLEGGEFRLKDRVCHVYPADIGHRFKLDRHLAAEAMDECLGRSLCAKPLIREILAAVENAAVLSAEFAVVIVGRLVEATTGQRIDGQL